ncbi:MAG TPA: alpha/beta hydrolase [Stellaceae bacterium]|nr:alpha/beta hydrolase [Stellaceae bacterium]
MRRFAMLLLAIPIVAYVLVVAAIYVGQRRLLFLPRPGVETAIPPSPAVTALRTEAEDGVIVTHWLAPAPAGRPTAVLFHGNAGAAGDLMPWAEGLQSAGYGVVLADYRGYSGNPGTPSETGLYADARALLAALNRRGIEDRDIVLFGWSLGSGVATEMALEHRVRALVLLAPFDSAVDVAAGHYPWVPVRALMWDRFDSRDKIARVDRPVMIVHGTADDVVPVARGRALFAVAREPKRLLILPQVGHWIDPAHALGAVTDFLERRP